MTTIRNFLRESDMRFTSRLCTKTQIQVRVCPLPVNGEGLGVGFAPGNLSPNPLSACGEGEDHGCSIIFVQSYQHMISTNDLVLESEAPASN